MSSVLVTSENKKKNEKNIPTPQPPSPISKTSENKIPSDYELLTKIWRVKLYNLKENGEWDDKGIGHVFCAEIFEDKNDKNSEKIPKLIMTKENNSEIIFSINLNDENYNFHNQRGTILTWKNSKKIVEDDSAISFQDKDGVNEIWKNIMSIRGINSDDDSFSLNDEQPNTDLEVSVQNLPNLCNEYSKNIDEQKLYNFINVLKETNYDFIKKLGILLDEEEKKIEGLKNSVVSFSLLSQETACSIDMSSNNNSNNNIENSNDENKGKNNYNINNKDVNKIKTNKIFQSETLNYIFTIFKNLISIGDKDLLEILFNDDCYLITFGALEYDFQSKQIVPHRRYFKEVVKFKNPLNLTYKNILKKINQILRLTYLKDTALSRLIEENVVKQINIIIQNNHNEIIQYFLNNEEYFVILFKQMENNDINIKKNAVLFLAELVNCAKSNYQNKIIFNETLCKDGILQILSKIIDNTQIFNQNEAKNDMQIININAIEILISIISAVPLLLKEYLQDNNSNLFEQLTNLLLYHKNFGVKYEVSQIFKTLIENEEQQSFDKIIFFINPFNKFLQFLNNNDQNNISMNKNEISSTKQIIIEIFISWFSNNSFNTDFWIEDNQLNEIINTLLKENDKIVNLYAIKLLRCVLDNIEEYLYSKIMNKNTLDNLITIFNTNMKNNNLIFSSIRDFFDSISINNKYLLNILMNYQSSFFLDNSKYFNNLILRYENKPTPKRQLLALTKSDNNLNSSFKEIDNIFQNEKENDREVNYLFENYGDYDDEENNLEEFDGNNINFLCRKRSSDIFEDDFDKDFKFMGKNEMDENGYHRNLTGLNNDHIGIELDEMKYIDEDEIIYKSVF